MSWPTPQDYNEAIQNPQQNLADPELQAGKIEVNQIGLPKVMSGSFASVYHFKSAGREFAVRCFLRQTADIEQRYEKISKYVMSDDLPYTLDFNFQREGIRVHGRWFPIIRMDWVAGTPLDVYVRKHVHDNAKMQRLAEQFSIMAKELKRGGIAHGDLQHGNIIVLPSEELRLVDYDGMFVPELSGCQSIEIGHRNYQHPGRSAHHFSEKLDNFSVWSIHTSLNILAQAPELLHQLNGGDECLLFRQNDYRFPARSKAFHHLETKTNEHIASLSRQLRGLLSHDAGAVPFLGEPVKDAEQLPLISEATFGTTITNKQLPDWMQTDVRPVEDEDIQGTWPTLVEYIRAAAQPQKSFTDAEITGAILALDHGSIRPITGDQGAVFRYHLNDEVDIAVKVFLKPDGARDRRYRELQSLLDSDAPAITSLKKHLVKFDFQPYGIKVGTKHYPIVKMEWQEGKTLFDYLEGKRRFTSLLPALAERLSEVARLLTDSGLVHGNIEPDNIMVLDGEVTLIDYDDMFSPAYSANPANITRNPHFRHPKAGPIADAANDAFAFVCMATSINCLAVHPDFWEQLGVKRGRLLFHRSDLEAPATSAVFGLLQHHYSPTVVKQANALAQLCGLPPNVAPKFLQQQHRSLLPESQAATTQLTVDSSGDEDLVRPLTIILAVGLSLSLCVYWVVSFGMTGFLYAAVAISFGGFLLRLQDESKKPKP